LAVVPPAAGAPWPPQWRCWARRVATKRSNRRAPRSFSTSTTMMMLTTIPSSRHAAARASPSIGGGPPLIRRSLSRVCGREQSCAHGCNPVNRSGVKDRDLGVATSATSPGHSPDLRLHVSQESPRTSRCPAHRRRCSAASSTSINADHPAISVPPSALLTSLTPEPAHPPLSHCPPPAPSNSSGGQQCAKAPAERRRRTCS
jgi:hypothetical protein